MRRMERCVVLFSRSPLEEGTLKGMARARPLFERARRRMAAAAASLPGVAFLAPRQPSGTFGERLIDALDQARRLGFGAIVAVPADTPALGPRQIAAAFDALESHPVVLGPAPDGGVYLIGLASGADPARLLARVRWRTPRVLRDLIAAAPEAALLEDRLADLDRPEDLPSVRAGGGLDPACAALIRDFLAPTLPARRAPAPSPRREAFPPSFRLRGPPLPATAAQV